VKAAVLSAWETIAVGVSKPCSTPCRLEEKCACTRFRYFIATLIRELFVFGAAGLVPGALHSRLTLALLEVLRRPARSSGGRRESGRKYDHPICNCKNLTHYSAGQPNCSLMSSAFFQSLMNSATCHSPHGRRCILHCDFRQVGGKSPCNSQL
jgi:hypothetical protein